MSAPSFDADLVRAVADVYDDVRDDREPSERSLRLVTRALEAGARIRLEALDAVGGHLGGMAAELRNLGPDALRLVAFELLLLAGVPRCPTCGSESLAYRARADDRTHATCDDCGTSWPVEHVEVEESADD